MGRAAQIGWALFVMCCPALSAEYPAAVTLQDFPDADTNGYYVLAGTQGQFPGTQWVFQRFAHETSSNRWVTIRVDETVTPPKWSLQVYDIYPEAWSTGRKYRTLFEVQAETAPEVWTQFIDVKNGNVSVSGSGISHFQPVVSDPYADAFPDWNSAVIYVPLGFTFGLGAWFTALAFGVPIGWIRMLGDASS